MQVFIYVLSADQENDADVLGMVAASLRPRLLEDPVRRARWRACAWAGSKAKWILNPTFQQLEFSDVDIVVSGTADSIMMVEGGAGEISEAEMVEALKVAQKGLQELVALQQELLGKHSVPKMEWTKSEPPADLLARVRQLAEPRIAEAMNLAKKEERVQALGALQATVVRELGEEFPDQGRVIGGILGGPAVPHHAQPGAGAGRAGGRARRDRRSGPSPARSASCPASTARRCSPAARPRRW